MIIQTANDVTIEIPDEYLYKHNDKNYYDIDIYITKKEEPVEFMILDKKALNLFKQFLGV